MRLSIIISTLNKGILNLEKTIRIKSPNLQYLIIHQNHENIVLPPFLNRDDITVIPSKTKGLSKSRNIGIENCKTKYALISDDDVEYIESGITQILELLETEQPNFAFFKIKTYDGEPPYKNYPQTKLKIDELKLPFSSIEMLLNIELMQKYNLKFDERFGLGSQIKRGEEKILIYDFLQKGLTGVFYPNFIVKHPYESSGKKKENITREIFSNCAIAKRIGKHYLHKAETKYEANLYKILNITARLYIQFT